MSAVNYPPFDPSFPYPGISSGDVPYVGHYGCWECLPNQGYPKVTVYKAVTPPPVPVAVTPEPAWGALVLFWIMAMVIWFRARRAAKP